MRNLALFAVVLLPWKAVGQDSPPSTGARRITLEQVKQSVDPPAANPFTRLGQLQIEAAKQHRLASQADYYPKFGAFFSNLHSTQFLGQVLRFHFPMIGLMPVQVPIISKDQTTAALTFMQPITPLFTIHEAVKIARADERIAIAKAADTVAKSARQSELEETYFKLLIAQRRLIHAHWKLDDSNSQALYASNSIGLARGPSQDLDSDSAEVKQLTASLNRALGWPEDTALDLAMPEPLAEDISFQEVAGKSAAGSLEVVEAEQNVVKARAAATISKLEYVPTVAAVRGYLFQNAFPAVLSNFGYGGVVASYNLFDFGKREHAAKEARAQVGMAELALQMTKAKVAADAKKAYDELERSRQLSQMAQKMGSSVAVLMNVSSAPQTLEIKAARADVKIDMLQADLAHRQAYARLKALLGEPR